MKPISEIQRKALREFSPVHEGGRTQSLGIVQQILVARQYLKPDAFETQSLDSATSDAIADYQKQYGLFQSGELDPGTIESLATPKCAMADGGLSLAVECRWHVAKLRYAFENFTTDVSEGSIRNAIQRAFQTWSDVCEIEFEQVALNEPHSISLAWHVANHSDYDLTGADIAHADYPGACAEVNPGGVVPIHFDQSECRWTDDADWKRDDTLAVPVYDIETVALHEIGHLLGLRHSPIPGDTLYGAMPRTVQRTLGQNDVLRIRHLYELG